MENRQKVKSSYSRNAGLFLELQLRDSSAMSWVAHLAFIAEAIVIMHYIALPSAKIEDSLTSKLYAATGLLKVGL